MGASIPMILHMDMDAFFASVEQFDHPELRGKCVIVGTATDRGVVTTASYEARRFGVHSAMPAFQARRLCPQGIFVPPRRERYAEVSARIMATLETVSPRVEPVSIDEAYMDITGCGRLFGTPDRIGRRVKDRVCEETGLTCSVGIAPVKFLAKIASDMEKPDGLTVICPDAVPEVIAALPVEKVPGVGKTTAALLHGLGIRTLGDVNRYSEGQLSARLGKFGPRLLRMARGEDDSPVIVSEESRSMGSETTLAADTMDPECLRRMLLAQSETVARRLRRHGLRAKCITLKLKHDDFTQITRSTTLACPVQSGRAIHAAVVELLSAYRLPRPVRLIGVGASRLLPEGSPVQQSLFPSETAEPKDWDQADRAVDAIAEKFGRDTVRRASLIDPEDTDGQ